VALGPPRRTTVACGRDDGSRDAAEWARSDACLPEVIALRALGWAALLCAFLASLAGAIVLRPARRWTTPRALVVSRSVLEDASFEPPVSYRRLEAHHVGGDWA
jgi:hypothetical protein